MASSLRWQICAQITISRQMAFRLENTSAYIIQWIVNDFFFQYSLKFTVELCVYVYVYSFVFRCMRYILQFPILWFCWFLYQMVNSVCKSCYHSTTSKYLNFPITHFLLCIVGPCSVLTDIGLVNINLRLFLLSIHSIHIWFSAWKGCKHFPLFQIFITNFC